MQRMNRAQGVGLLIAFGLALFAFGRWVVTVGASQGLAIAGRLAIGEPPGITRTVIRGGAHGSGAAHLAFPSPSQISATVPRVLVLSGVPPWGRMLIWLGLIALWAVCALILLRDKPAREQQRDTVA
jgi:hypothetical protein